MIIKDLIILVIIILLPLIVVRGMNHLNLNVTILYIHHGSPLFFQQLQIRNAVKAHLVHNMLQRFLNTYRYVKAMAPMQMLMHSEPLHVM